MKRFTLKRLILLSFAVALASWDIFGAERLASAGPSNGIIIEARLSTDGTWTQLAHNSDAGVFGGVHYTSSKSGFGSIFQIVTASSVSNSPGEDNSAQLFSGTTQIKNISSSAATLLMAFGATDFASPVTQPAILMSSHFAGTYTGALLTSFQSYVDQGNGLGDAAFGSALTTSLQTPGGGSGSFSSDAYYQISSLGDPYSIAQWFSVTLAAGESMNFSSNTTLVNTAGTVVVVTPEPASLVLFGIGAAGMCGFGWRRRKATT